jgi:hypothetical protein
MFKEMVKNATPEEVALLDEFERVLLVFKEMSLCREVFEAQKKEYRRGVAAMIVWRAVHEYHERVDELAPYVEEILKRDRHLGLALPTYYPTLKTNFGRKVRDGQADAS